jgi:hypothetical protein
MKVQKAKNKTKSNRRKFLKKGDKNDAHGTRHTTAFCDDDAQNDKKISFFLVKLFNHSIIFGFEKHLTLRIQQFIIYLFHTLFEG